jgi:NAD(P)-dependent dehydrogenase (short-subunit alcohol dehydrogenase family)
MNPWLVCQEVNMRSLSGKVALVTGASRGVGKGIAMALGDAGVVVYITGRTVEETQAAVPLPGTVGQTAAEVTRLGGQGIAVPCDHRDDSQVEAVFRRIQQEQGRLDILVNNAWAGYEGYIDNRHLPPLYPFWEKPIAYWDENLIGVRWAYVASVLAAKHMVPQHAGLIVNISFSPLEPGNPSYNAAKTAVDRMTGDMAHQLREHQVAVIALHPGLVRTEGVLVNAQYFDFSNSESPQFTGRAVAALAADPSVMEKTGQVLNVARLAQEYDFDDIDGTRPRPI